EADEKALERCRSAGFQPATPLDSIRAGKMPALQRASRPLFHQPAKGTANDVEQSRSCASVMSAPWGAWRTRFAE
ncbi:MAG: hypothetical protein ABSA59_25045, partial [Terriglobia bacterium]